VGFEDKEHIYAKRIVYLYLSSNTYLFLAVIINSTIIFIKKSLFISSFKYLFGSVHFVSRDKLNGYQVILLFLEYYTPMYLYRAIGAILDEMKVTAVRSGASSVSLVHHCNSNTNTFLRHI